MTGMATTLLCNTVQCSFRTAQVNGVADCSPSQAAMQVLAACAPGNILSLSGGAPVQGAGRKQQRCYRQGVTPLSHVRVAQLEPLKTHERV
jgi:hypothetical protein